MNQKISMPGGMIHFLPLKNTFSNWICDSLPRLALLDFLYSQLPVNALVQGGHTGILSKLIVQVDTQLFESTKKPLGLPSDPS